MADPKKVDYTLENVPTNMTLTSEQFEKLYLAPKTPVAGDLRKTFGNPTPVAVMGFIVGLTPLSIEFMGWRGSGGGGVATGTVSLWFGGMLLIISGLLEFLLGNTFPSVVFFGYGSHFISLATTFIPYFNAVAALAPANDPSEQTPEFLASYGFYLLSMCLLSFCFFLCSFRTNVVFVLVFICATIGFGMATGAFWNLAAGNVTLGTNLITGTGACFFAASMLGWYLFFALMLGIMDIVSIPVFDLSTKIKGMSERKAEKMV